MRSEISRSITSGVALLGGNAAGLFALYYPSRDELPKAFHLVAEHSSNFTISAPCIFLHLTTMLLTNPETFKGKQKVINVAFALWSIALEMDPIPSIDVFVKESIPDMAVGFIGLYTANVLVNNLHKLLLEPSGTQE